MSTGISVHDYMALNGTYSIISIHQHEDSPLLSQFIANCDYQANLPREEEICISSFLLDILNAAKKGYEYTIDGRKITKPRKALGYNIIQSGLTPEQAHELRKKGQIKVFPDKISHDAQAKLEPNKLKGKN